MDFDLSYRSDFSVELVDHMGNDHSVLQAMMVSTRRDREVGRMTEEEQRGKIGFLMRNRHGTPFEHNAMIWRIEAPICVFREWHRHRIGFSYNETSARYVEMPPVFYIPPHYRPLVQEGKPGHYQLVPGTDAQYQLMRGEHERAYLLQYGAYKRMLAAGIAKEVARNVLGVGLYSAMYVTCNARSLMSFLSLRTRDDRALYHSKPQWEIEQCARAMETEGERTFKMLFPITYEAYCQAARVAP